MILVTGGAGFIGSNFVLDWLNCQSDALVNVDKLTYAGNLHSLEAISSSANYHFIHGDILDRELLRSLLVEFKPRAIVHFAAESHVDRSLYQPEVFASTNIMGTLSLLDESLSYWQSLQGLAKEDFRFLHVSTDEVFGSIEATLPPVCENAPYAPNSPYAASKAASDHLVRAYNRTYGLPTIITHASNNFGPYQFPEKLIPLTILSCLQSKTIPLYGDGLQVRNWVHVSDHCKALRLLLDKGRVGESYNIGGDVEPTNKELIELICTQVENLRPHGSNIPYNQLVHSVKDRPGHDRRYALDSSKLKALGWSTEKPFEEALRETIQWYLGNPKWLEQVVSGEYQEWVKKHYE